MAASLLLLLPTGASSSSPLPAISLKLLPSSGHRVLVDSFGRERAFHGANTIVKGPPWVPSRTGFDVRTSLVKEDFEIMRRAGLNVIRLGVMWPGVEPRMGVYNRTYLEEIRAIAAEAATYGIYTLADMHQDVLSEHFCGEGIPSWAVPPPSSGLVKFPVPLGLPYETEPATGFPTRQACNKIVSMEGQGGWPAFHGAVATGEAFEHLYTDFGNITRRWGTFWAEVAKTFTDNSNGGGSSSSSSSNPSTTTAPTLAPELLGLELINEPFAGNPYKDPLIMVPGVADRQKLEPAYDVVAAEVRAVAPDALLFFAGTTWDRTGNHIGDALPMGFTHPPGGAAAANVSVSAFHYYEPPQSKADTDHYFGTRLDDAKRLGTGLFLTESSGSQLFDRAAPAAEARGLSWIAWEWKDFCRETAATRASASQQGAFGACKTGYGAGPFKVGDDDDGSSSSDDGGRSGSQDPESVVDLDALKRFARPFAPAIAGSFVSSSYDDYVKIFSVTFTADLTIQAPTELSLPELTYPDGFEFKISGTDALELVRVDGGASVAPRKQQLNATAAKEAAAAAAAAAAGGGGGGGGGQPKVTITICPRLGSGRVFCRD
eukprot:g519.t1